MMAPKRKRTLKEEGRAYNEEWKLKYFLVPHKDKMICLLCNTVISCLKKYNANLHYEIHKKNKYYDLEGEERKIALNKLKETREHQQQTFMKVFHNKDNANTKKVIRLKDPNDHENIMESDFKIDIKEEEVETFSGVQKDIFNNDPNMQDSNLDDDRLRTKIEIRDGISEVENDDDISDIKKEDASNWDLDEQKMPQNISLDEALTLINCPDGDSDIELDLDEDAEELESSSPPETLSDLINEGRVEVESKEIDEEVDIPFKNFIGNKDKREPLPVNPKGCSESCDSPQDIEWKDRMELDESWIGECPMFFFNLLFENQLFDVIRDETNLYALREDRLDIKVSTEEIRIFIGILIYGGIVNIPSYRFYWKAETRFALVAEAMSRNRFEQIKRYLHFNDNAKMKHKDNPHFDKCFKIRPIFERIRRNCLKMPQEEYQIIGEQIIPTKARSSLKMYNPKKPHKWGYKVILRAGESGFVYDFHLYTGKGTYNSDSTLCKSSSFVKMLVEDVPKHKNYKVFYGDWFSSLELSNELKKDGIYSLANVRPSNEKNCNLEINSSLKMKDRGGVDGRVDCTSNNIALKWHDNKAVHLLSSYTGIEPMAICKRWDGNEKKHIDVPCPFAMKEYNEFMGGVELSDVLIELYRINFKSTKFYMRIIFYLIDMCVANSWLLYRRTVKKDDEYLCLVDFKLDIARSLLQNKLPGKRVSEIMVGPSPKRRQTGYQPPISLRFDHIDHLPDYVEMSNRCRMCIKAHTKVICIKCKIGLCFTPKRNCFLNYHSK